jgi:hypothetical protein
LLVEEEEEEEEENEELFANGSNYVLQNKKENCKWLKLFACKRRNDQQITQIICL